MPIRVKCENCKKTLSVKDHLAGKKIKCPVCQTVVTVPTVAPMKDPPAASGKESAAPAKPPSSPSNKPAPTARPAPPGTTTKPAIKTKPKEEKPASNGTPAPHAATGNGTPAPPDAAAVPPENVEEEAFSAWADEPPPPEETQEPKFIEFKCQWCDEPVKLPIELAGKQSQCPHEDCRRIIKVPMPKAPEKKDWKKMDTRGPALARINQPEQLENAWGTQEATKAKQASLIEAGAIDVAPKTRPRDVFDWIRLGFYATLATAAVVAIGFGFWSMISTKQQSNSLKEAKDLVEGKKPKITSPPLLMAEAHRTIGLLYLASKEKDPAYHASNYLAGASGVKYQATDKNPALNEQFLLIDVALSQIELGDVESETIGGAKIEWKKLPEILEPTLRGIQSPEAQVMALREVGSRLFDKGQPELAIGLTSKFSSRVGKGAIPLAYRQQIALIFARDDKDTLKNLPSDKNLKDPNVRVGYAEGHARKGEFDKADEFIKAPGPAKDRLDASLGVAAVALLDPKNKQRAGDFVKQAMQLSKENTANPTDWQLLLLVKLAARTEDAETARAIAKRLSQPAFKLRAELEIFLALCENSTSVVEADKLAEIENADKAPAGKKDANAGATLGLAWTALARRNTQLGYSRAAIRKMLDDRIAVVAPPIDAEILRAMVDLGAIQGSLK